MDDYGAIPLGVCVLPEPEPNRARTVSYPHYIQEILEHAGVCYRAIGLQNLREKLPQLRLLVTLGETELPEDLKASLRDWVGAGGGWISVGGICGLEELLGARYEPPAYTGWATSVSTLGEGYLQPVTGNHPILEPPSIPLHFFNGIPAQAQEAESLAVVLDAHQRPTDRQAVLENRVGQGRCLLIAPDVTGTVVRIQQGLAVTRDGVSAPDGSAPVCDGVLKSGDGGVLDWLFDRQPVPGVPGLSAFLQPIADQWRTLLLRAIFTLAHDLDVALPLLWLYPRNLPALGHLSHDTDNNNSMRAQHLLAVLEAAQVHSTWCVILPGYDPKLMSAIRAAGHELATHYDSVSAEWSEAEFERQWRHLCALLTPDIPVTNKNHYLRWEGDVEFFDWCARRGILLDQSKGASKTGEAGFNFGTCHPYLPIAFDGRTIGVLELPTPTQDLEVFAPEVLREPLLEAVLKQHGILHLLFHPDHIEKPGVAEALQRSVAEGRARGMEWWTARQIAEWERARRQARWHDYRREAGGVAVRLHVEEALEEAAALWLCRRPARLEIDGEERLGQAVTRWGFPFQAVTHTFEKDTEITLRHVES
ncbi:MAG TPA: hypothetical protein VFA07_13620 [Chthonomonadaceae bacterium]|nr:hypothetical protein [Chthonomonadaceae bacterium]